jgi:hypothetical protein
MTKRMTDVLELVSRLPEGEQDQLAERWLAELKDEAEWNDRFAKSDDVLSKIAQRVRADVAAGKAVDKGIDEP